MAGIFLHYFGMLCKIPFFIGNLAACFTPGSNRRHAVRTAVNRVMFAPFVAYFVRRQFHVRVHSVKLVRQVTLGRVVFQVNDDYFVKVFRSVSNRRLRRHARLLRRVIDAFAASDKCSHIAIPPMVVSRCGSMYASVRVPGRHMADFSPDQILQNQDKIAAQVHDIIDTLQSIDIDSIPPAEICRTPMQARSVELAGPQRPVLAHFDLNRSNCLFDADMNILSVLDWDQLSIARNPETDHNIFMKNWTGFLKAQREKLNKK